MASRPPIAHTEAQLFAELRGLVLLDPELLDGFCGGRSRDRDLLQLFSETDAGDHAARAGIAIPVLGLRAGYYTVNVREDAARSGIAGSPSACSTGWVLHAVSAEIILGGIGYLKRWDPDHLKLRRIALPAGWYSVDISLGEAALGGDDFALDFKLRASESQPELTADLGFAFSDAEP